VVTADTTNAQLDGNGVPKGIRTLVTAVKGRCPRPLDDGDARNNEGLGGARRDRTADLLHAMQALSQLSYSPTREARNLGTDVCQVKPAVANSWSFIRARSERSVRKPSLSAAGFDPRERPFQTIEYYLASKHIQCDIDGR
jgi:hypothetical protein